MEAAMIANPKLKFYQYNPYTKVKEQKGIRIDFYQIFSIEEYAHEKMLATRHQQIEKFVNIKRVGIILGVLGRQGSPHIMEVFDFFVECEFSFYPRKLKQL